MKKTYALIAGILMLSGGALAQSVVEDNNQVVIAGAQNGAAGEKDQTFTYIEKVPLPPSGPGRPEDFRFFTAMSQAAKVVKNAPYTANEVTETTQTLGDGNRIVNRTSASVTRDSEGRTRREESGVKVGSLQASGPKIVTINDPVAHTQYMFQPGGEPGSEGVMLDMGGAKAKVKTFGITKNETGKVQFGAANERGTKTWITIDDKGEDADVKTESLGTQVIEGINAEGTRNTRTIPAGAIGNEKPIVITSEIWTSPDLQVTVLSKRNDPRFGETVYKLTDISRAEPDPSLFQPPSNLKKELPYVLK